MNYYINTTTNDLTLIDKTIFYTLEQLQTYSKIHPYLVIVRPFGKIPVSRSYSKKNYVCPNVEIIKIINLNEQHEFLNIFTTSKIISFAKKNNNKKMLITCLDMEVFDNFKFSDTIEDDFVKECINEFKILKNMELRRRTLLWMCPVSLFIFGMVICKIR